MQRMRLMVVAALMVALPLVGGSAFASDFLLQAEGANNAAAGGYSPSTLSELGTNFSLTGFFRNETGVFVNANNRRYFVGNSVTGTPLRNVYSANSLATERNFLEVDVGDHIGETNRFFARLWFVYEPEYSSEQPIAIGAENTDDFYNQYGVHEWWWRSRWHLPFGTRLNLFLGRQIVMWGQSVAFRVADVVNPVDTSYDFGFANLEESRLPINMIHPILELPDWGITSSNYIEAVYAPGIDPLYTQVDFPDDRFEGENSLAGRVNILAPSGNPTGFNPARFGIPVPPHGIPYNTDSIFYPNVPSRTDGPPKVIWRLPRATFANSVVGVRLHSYIGLYEATLFYWKGFQYTNVPYIVNAGKGIPFHPGWQQPLIYMEYPGYQGVGGSADRPIYLPPPFSQIPMVLRGEFFYANHQPFGDINPNSPSGVSYSDTFNMLLGLDVTSAYVPEISKTGDLNFTLEWENLTTLDLSKYDLAIPLYPVSQRKNDSNLTLVLGDSWWWNSVAPTWIMAYNPDGNTVLLFPNLTLTPPWTNKYFFTLVYINAMGNNKYQGGALFKGDQMFIFEFQYNFDVRQMLGI